MIRRFNTSLTLSLSLILVLGPTLSLASHLRKPLLSEPTNSSTSMHSGGRRSDIPFSKPPVFSAILGKRPQRDSISVGEVAGQSVTLLPDGRALKVGGLENGSPVAGAVVNDSRRGDSPTAMNLHYARAFHTATLLPDGTVLVAGGVGANGQAVESIELFDPETQTFTLLVVSGLTARVYHTATLLTDGGVLFAGGLSSDGNTLGKVERWDFRSRTATRLPGMLRTARYGHTATLLPNGDALLWGGIDKKGAQIKNGEQYIFTSTDARTINSGRFRVVNELPEQADDDALHLEASFPGDGDTGVPLDSFIALRFSRALQVETVSTETVTLTGSGATIGTKVVAAEGGMLAFVTPKLLLLPGTTYTLAIAGPTDAMNNRLASAALSFTTASLKVPYDAPDDEAWIPGANNLQGDWRSGRADSRWRSLPPLQAEPGVTALAGQALTLNGKPLAGVALEIDGQSVATDDTGRFLLSPLLLSIPHYRQSFYNHNPRFGNNAPCHLS